MALTTCRECDKPLSTEAPTCPHCGVRAGDSAASTRKTVALLLLSVGTLGVLAALVLGFSKVTVPEAGRGLAGLGNTDCGSVFSRKELNPFLGDQPCIDKRGGRQSLVVSIGLIGLVSSAAGGTLLRADTW